MFLERGTFCPPFAPKWVAPQTPINSPVRRCNGVGRKRILIMRMGAHGDILMGTPLLTALRDALPDAHLTWLVARKEAAAIDAHPEIDEVLLWESDYFAQMQDPRYRLTRRFLDWRLRQTLRSRRYDVFISFQPEEWPWLTEAVGSPTRIGVFDTFRQFTGETQTSPHTRLFTHAYTFQDLPAHRTDQYLLPLKALGLPEPVDKRMSMGLTRGDGESAEGFLRARGIVDGDMLVTLAPMTTWVSRCWPPDRYAALGDRLVAETGCRVVLLSSPRDSERQAVQRIADHMKTRPVLALGELSFRGMAALIARSALLVSGDTGPMHVAAAVGTPYLALFGSTPAAARAPQAGCGAVIQHPVPCGPCDQDRCPLTGPGHMRCMDLISVPQAFQAARSLLGGAQGSSGKAAF